MPHSPMQTIQRVTQIEFGYFVAQTFPPPPPPPPPLPPFPLHIFLLKFAAALGPPYICVIINCENIGPIVVVVVVVLNVVKCVVGTSLLPLILNILMLS